MQLAMANKYKNIDEYIHQFEDLKAHYMRALEDKGMDSFIRIFINGLQPYLLFNSPRSLEYAMETAVALTTNSIVL